MPTDKTPNPNPNLTDDAHRIATDAVNAIEAFTKAAAALPADVARLALDAVQAAANKATEVITKATK